LCSLRTQWLVWTTAWAANIKIIFAYAMVLASAFITLPLSPAVIPVLEEAGSDQEEAAKTLG